MVQKLIISLVMLALVISTYTVGLISSAFAFLAFSLLVYYAMKKDSLNRCKTVPFTTGAQCKKNR